MSTIYDKTDNYALSLYGDNDPADLRDGYNNSMRTIDATLETHLNRIEAVESRETHDEEVVKALIGDNTVDNATAAKAKWDKAGTDATTAEGKADTNKAILDALGANSTGDATAQKNNWDMAAQKSESLETRVQTLERPKRRNIVLLGDSWTVVHNNALYNQLQNDLPNAIWHNYGINGAVVQRLPEMVEHAKADGGLHHDEVTDVIIVMGTNNVFWTNLDGFSDITRDSAYSAFKAVRDYFPNANILFFPNNSKTLNDGRNVLYALMAEGAQKAGVATVLDSLILLCGHLEWFNGDDQEGVQHLSDKGYELFADRIAGVLQGASMLEHGLVGPPQYNTAYNNPTSQAEVDDDTVQIYFGDPLRAIGWLSNPNIAYSYRSDQTVDVSIGGVIHVYENETSLPPNGICFIGCPNWWKRIAKHTLPYLFLGSHYNNGCLISHTESGFKDDYMLHADSTYGNTWLTKSFYFSIPMPGPYLGKTINIRVRALQTSVTGAGR